MAKLAELLHLETQTSEKYSSAWLLKFAYLLGVPVKRAEYLVMKHGNGIYVRGMYIAEDSPYWRRKTTFMYGKCIIIRDIEMIIRTEQDTGRVRRAKLKQEKILERKRIQREQQAYDVERKRKRLFRSMQAESCPKHQGKGNAPGDIGRFVNRIIVCQREPVVTRHINWFNASK